VIGLIFISLVLASALDPWVDKLERRRIPRGVSLLVMYLLILSILGLVTYLLIPPLVDQIGGLLSSLKEYTPQVDSLLQRLTQSPDVTLLNQIKSSVADLNSSLTNITSSVFGAVANVFSGIGALLVVLVITFYLTVEEDGLKKFVRSIAPIRYQPYLVQKANRIQEKMGNWLRGQLIIMLAVGVMAFIGLLVLGVPFALVLAVFAAVAEFVPFLGPLIAAIPAVFFAWTDSPWKAVGVIILYVIIQQLENQVLSPKVMQKVVGLNPILVIAVVLVGAKVAGIVGILLAVPAATITGIFLEDLFQKKKELDNQLEFPTGDVPDEPAQP
jgi:predicted PurR-regulated permease PerM